MKRLVYLLLALTAINSTAQLRTFAVAVGEVISNSGAYTPVFNQAQLDAAGPDQSIEIRGDFSVPDGYTPPAKQTWYFTLGKIDATAGVLNLNGTRPYFNGENVAIDLGQNGTLSGTWDPPPHFYASNFGMKYDAVPVFTDGSINSGSTTFTTTSTTFTASDVGKEIAVVGAGGATDAGQPFGRVLKTTIASFTNANTVELATAATATVGNQNFMYGTDNYNVMFNAHNFRNAEKGGMEYAGNGIGGYNTVLRNSDLTAVPNGIVIGNDRDGISVFLNSTLKLFPHDLDQSHGMTFYRTNGSSITGSGIFEGEFDLNPQANDKGEHNHGIAIFNQANRGVISGLTIRNWHADAIYGQGNPQRQNQIDGANFVDASTDSEVGVGYIATDGTIDTGNTDYAYTTSFLNVTGPTWDNITSRGDERYFHLTGGSFGNWGGMKSPYYWVAYFDASDNFIWRSSKLRWYDKTLIPYDNAAKVLVMIENSPTLADVQLELRPDLRPHHWEFSNLTLHDNGRHGVANPPSHLNFFASLCWNIGHPIIAAGPGYCLNCEDGGQMIQYTNVHDVHFWNAWGLISLKNTLYAKVYSSTFGINSTDLSAAPTNDIEVGVSASLSYHAEVYRNEFYYVQNSVGRDTRWDNDQIGGRFTFGASGALIEGGTFENVEFRSITDPDSDRIDHNDLMRNVEIYVSEHMPGYLFEMTNNMVDLENVNIRYNWAGKLRPDLESTDLDIVLGGTKLGETVNRMFLRGAMTEDYGSEWKNVNITGLRTISDTSSGNAEYPITNHHGGTYGTNINLGDGLQRDFGFFGSKINGWIQADLNQWGTTLSADPGIFSLEDAEVVIDDRFAVANNGFRILEIAERDAEFYAKNTLFEIKPTYSLVNTKKWITHNNLGQSVYEECIFRSSLSNLTWDLTDTSEVGPNAGPLILRNPDLDKDGDGVNDITIIPRPGIDIIYYTKVMPGLPVYADTAAANAAGYPIDALFKTPTGQLMVNQ